MEAARKTINDIGELDPQRPVFVNLLPYPYGPGNYNDYLNWGMISSTNETTMINDYEQYLNNALNTNMPYLSIDDYPQYMQRTGITPDLYYSDLRRLVNINNNHRSGAIGTNRNIITNNCVLVVDHDGYQVYNQDIDYQVSTSLAFGIKMIMYFTYNYVAEWDHASMLDASKNPTATYYYVQSINKWAKNVGDELFNKDVKAVYFYEQYNCIDEGSIGKYIEFENRTGQIGRINPRKVIGEAGGSETGEASHAIVSVFDDNTIMLVNADAAYVSNASEAAAYNSTASGSKSRGKYVFLDYPMSSYQYFDSINNSWKSITSNVNRLSDMGLYISYSTTAGDNNYILLDQGKNVLLKLKSNTLNNNYTLTSTKYKIDSNKKYIYTGTSTYASSNVSISGGSLGNVANNSQHITTSTGHYDNIPIVTLSLGSYTLTGANTNGTGGSITISDNINTFMSRISVTNGYAVYNPSDNKMRIYSNKGALVDTKSIITAKTNLNVPTVSSTTKTYNGTSQGPNYSGYDSTKMSVSGDKATNAGNYTITFSILDKNNYQWNDGTTTDKSTSWTIEKANPIIVLSATQGSVTAGSTTTFTASATSGAGTLRVSSSNSSIATATISNGTVTVTGVAAGSATITVTSDSSTNYNSKSATFEVTVNSAEKQTPTLTLNPTSGSVTVGGTTTFTASITSGAGALSVRSQNSSIATATISGNTVTVTGKAAGSTRIEVESEENDTYKSVAKLYGITVNAKSVSGLTITLPNDSYTYNGSEQTPEPTVKDGSTTLTKGTHYTVSYSNNTGVGTATVTITGKGNYTGTKDKTFTITQRDISDANLILSQNSYEYSGSAHTPNVTAKIGSSTLTNITDYTVSYSNNINAGTATATITGKGNCTGTKSTTFTITKRTLAVTAEAKTKEYGAALPPLTYTYSGNVSIQTPGFTGGLKTTATQSSAIGEYDITNNDLALTDNGSFKASNYNMTFTGAKLTVVGKILSDYPVTVNPTSYTYDGNAKTPTVTIKDGNTTLTKDTDYTVAYSDNTNAGTGKVTITGKGNYSGTNTKGTFTINPANVDFGVTLSETSYEYDGSAKTPGVTVKAGNTTLTKDTDYTVAYSDNTNAGTGKVTITGKGNYAGSKTVNFTITKRTLTVTAENKQKRYNEDNPSLTYKYSGQVNNQTPEFTGSLTTSAEKGSNVGEYDITQGNLAMKSNSTFDVNNYNLTFVKGKLTIIKANGVLELSEEEGTIVLNCKKEIEVEATGTVSVTSSKANIATAQLKTNGKIEISGIAIGEATITVTSGETQNYEAATKTYGVTVIPVAIEGIEMKRLPKTSYIEGQELDVTNGKIKVTSNNGTSEEVSITRNMVTGYDKTQIGEQRLTVTYQGKTAEYTVVVRRKSVSRIEIKDMPNKLTYIQNYETLDVTGGKIQVYYDNDTTEILDITNDMISGYNNTRVGRTTVTVSYEGKECTFEVEIVEKRATNIEIIKLPDVLEYVQDYGILDVTGGKLHIVFDDETEAEIDMTKEMVTGFNNKQVGVQTLTVTFGGKTATYEVEIINKVITKIEVEELPSKTEYVLNYEELELEGAKLKITYNDSYNDTINIQKEMVSGFDNTKLGKITITVKYAGKETSFDVTIVEHSVVRVEVHKMPNKLQYKQGENINVTGGQLKIYYNDGTTEIVNMEEEMLETSEKLTTAGRKLITINAYGQEVSFEVDVIEEKTEEKNNENNNSNNSNNNGTKDNTTAKDDIPNTGVPTGVIIAGAITLTVSGGFAVMKMFKHKEIK